MTRPRCRCHRCRRPSFLRADMLDAMDLWPPKDWLADVWKR